MGERKITDIERRDVEALTNVLLKRKLAPKSVRNIMGFLHGVFEHGVDRGWPAPPPSPDVLGPVLRVVILAAAMTDLRQGELLGLRWRDVDWSVQRIRVRNTFVRGEHSAEGKSDLSTRRSVP